MCKYFYSGLMPKIKRLFVKTSAAIITAPVLLLPIDSMNHMLWVQARVWGAFRERNWLLWQWDVGCCWSHMLSRKAESVGSVDHSVVVYTAHWCSTTTYLATPSQSTCSGTLALFLKNPRFFEGLGHFKSLLLSPISFQDCLRQCDFQILKLSS